MVTNINEIAEAIRPVGRNILASTRATREMIRIGIVANSNCLRPDESTCRIAIKMHGSMSKHVTPLAKIEADSPSIPIFASKAPVPNSIRI